MLTVSKLVSLFKMMVVIVLTLISSRVYAEYYVSTTSVAPVVVCLSCQERVVYKRDYKGDSVYSRHSHRRHYQSHYVEAPGSCSHRHHYQHNSAEVSVYYVWQTIPSCGCGNVWVNADCMCRSQTVQRVYVQRTPDYVGFAATRGECGGYVSLEESDNFDPDMRTADDVADDPELNDNY